MVLSQIETMFSSGTKISVSVFDLNVIKITTTRRQNFSQSEQLSLKNNNPARLALYGKRTRTWSAWTNYRCDILWKVTNSLYCVLITPCILPNSYNMAFL